jgi:hypothetical protein
MVYLEKRILFLHKKIIEKLTLSFFITLFLLEKENYCEKMSDIDNEAYEVYNQLKKALDGIYEIISMNFEEDTMFYQCGMDNLEKLKETIGDLISHDYDTKEIKYKLRELEFDMKKCLFFKDQENK